MIVHSASTITIGVLLAAVLLCLRALSTGRMSSLLGLVAVPLGVSLLGRPDIWLALAVALYQSGLKPPLGGTNLTLYHVLSFLLIGALGLRLILNPRGRARRSPATKYALLFLAVLAVTMATRGLGLRILGSRLWGGAPYVSIVLAIGLFLLAERAPLSARLWRQAVLAMCLVAQIPALAQFAYLRAGERWWWLWAFVQIRPSVVGEDALSGAEYLMRYQTGMAVLLVMVPLLLFERPMRGARWIVTAFFVALAMLFAGFSGFRSAYIQIPLLVLSWLALRERRPPWGRLAAVGALFLAVLAVMALFARHLPSSFQRALSLIPFADVTPAVKADADATTIWRLVVWLRALGDIPKYWLLGSGFAFDPREVEIIMLLRIWSREWAFVTHNYHNGILSLLITLGVGGLFAGCAFLISIGRTHWRLTRAVWPDELSRRVHLVMTSWFTTQIVLFLTIYGDTQISFPMFFFQAMVLEGLALNRALALENPAAAEAGAAPPG